MGDLAPGLGSRHLAVGSTAPLYLVTREDLPPGVQACQALHAMREFAHHHPDVDKAWYTKSNYLEFKSTTDLASLEDILERARILGLPVAPFHEPDLGGALTALSLGPSPKARKLVGHLPRALQPR